MNTTQKRQPRGATRGVCRSSLEFGKPSARTPRLPADWRSKLCLPLDYYREHVPGLSEPDEGGMATGQCPLCSDRGGTLTVHVVNPRGTWICSASCGRGDMIEFAQRMFGLTFQQAVRDLIEVQT
jgi:hypothetical protein